MSNNLGQLSLESPSTSRVIADGLSVLNAFDYCFAGKVVVYIGERQLKHNDFISVIRVNTVFFTHSLQATNLTTLQTHNLYTAEHGSIDVVAVDWHNMVVYWGDSKDEFIAAGEISLSSMSVTKRKALFSNNLSYLKSIVIDPIGR